VQHLFNVTVLRICICEREYNGDGVVMLIKRADSVGLGQPRQTTEWFYEERPKCARTTMSTHPIVKNNCAQAELSKMRLLHDRSNLLPRRALECLGESVRVLNPLTRDVHFDACNLFDRLFSGHRDL
jgi:hypothetical protein